MKKALFIDRDGTVIAEPPADYQVDSLEKLEFIPGAISALRTLRELDFELVMATNQDGLGTEAFPEEDFRPPHEKMLRTLAGEGVAFDNMLIDRTFESDDAPTRKPRTGMFGRYTDGSYDLGASYVVGDRATDILLARNLGAKGILLAPAAEGRRMLREAGAEEACVLITDSWAEIAEYIRRGERRVVVTRETRETRITVRLDLDGRGFGTCGTAENEMAENGTTENGTEGRPENTADSKNGTSDDAAYGTCGAVRNGGTETGAGTLSETTENGLSCSPGNGTPGNRADSPGTPGTDIPPCSPAGTRTGCGGAPGDGISTGLRFLDHMLAQIAHHGGVSLTVEAHGDLDIDEHHTMEDVAIVLGEAIDRALGSKAGIGRYGFALPMDDCRALVLLDFGGRIDFEWDAEFRRERVGDIPTEMFRHFFHSLCCAARCNLQISARGGNDHHKAEAIFKAFARALRMAVARTGFGYDIPSSKGIL
ncbi:histidinol-phosphatase [Alistipes onderdonkii]|jgi:histidinol-phosphatase|uniref:Imidazoleglycerol-phosphate dehydratase n=1 Tax=Alistipes onderdonkii TaxID=328813 RepID=A0A1Y3QSM5_9BACT|nr:histidinol-phosphatase [Alistipes onderdonkii]OUN02653.1 histidinol-phosphatase [Alistipes onderdonkii]